MKRPLRNNCTSKKKQWIEQQMLDTMEDVAANFLNANAATKKHGVPPSTLKDRLSRRVIHGSKPRPKQYLSAAEEEELAGCLINAANIGYGKTQGEVLTIVES